MEEKECCVVIYLYLWKWCFYFPCPILFISIFYFNQCNDIFYNPYKSEPFRIIY